MEELYRKKENGRYEVAAYRVNETEVHPGLWLIQGEKRPVSFKNVGYYVSKLPDPVDVQKWMQIALNEDLIIEAIRRSGARLYDVSLQDVASAIVEQLYLLQQEEEDESR